MRTALALAAFVSLLATPAHAKPPYDVTSDRLLEVDASRRQGRFDFVVRELAATIALPRLAPASSLGLAGFEFRFSQRVAFPHVEPRPGESVSAWDEVVSSGEPSAVALLPILSVRKGLPLGIELEAHAGWLGGSSQFLAGGGGRVAPFGGWTRVPDVSLGLSYTGLAGNPDLRLGALALDAVVGYSFHTGVVSGKPTTRFSPWAGYSALWMHARLQGVPGLRPATGFREDAAPGVDPRNFVLHRAVLGMEVGAANTSFRIGFDLNFPRRSPVMACLDLGVALAF